MPGEKTESPTLAQLEGIVNDDPGPDSVADALREAMSETPTDDGADGGHEGEQDADSSVSPSRDDKGRFKAKDDVGEGEDGSESDPVAQNEDAPLEPPAEWTAKEHETFRGLPREAQQMVLERVNAATETSRKSSEAAQRYDALEKVVAPRREHWARDGLTEDVAIRQLLAVSDYATSKPAEFIAWFAQQRGIDLSAFKQAPSQAAAEDGGAGSPVVTGLQTKIAELQDQVSRLTGTVAGDAERAKAAQQADVDSRIAGFRAATDERGAPKHPYFDQVKAHMGALLERGLAKDLDTAYSMACRADPEVSAKIESARKSQEAREKAKADREKATAARNSGSSVSGQPGARTEPAFTGDLREDLRASFAERGML